MRKGLFAVGAIFGLGLAAYLSSAGGVSSVVQPATATQTAGSTTYYVATTGNDGNSCTAAGQECLTIRGAVNKIPKTVKHPTIVSVGAGTFDGNANVSGFYVEPATPAVGAYLLIKGTFVESTLTTGPASFTPTSTAIGAAPVGATMTKTGAGWTPHELKGRWAISEVAGVPRYYLIDDNTADVITVLGWTPKPSATATYTISENGTVISSAQVTYPVSATQAPPVANTYAFFLSGNRGWGKGFEGVHIQGFKFDISGDTSSPFFLGAGESLSLSYSRFSTNVKYAISGGTNTSMFIQKNVFDIHATGSAISTSGNNIRLYSQQNLYMACSRGIAAPGFVQVESWNEHFSCTTSAVRASSGLVYMDGATIDTAAIGVQMENAEWLMAFSMNNLSFQMRKCAISSAIGVNVKGPSSVTMEGISGTSSDKAIVAANGAQIYVDSTSTVAGTVADVLLDGVTHTLAEMRAASPKYLTDPTTGTRVWGN